MSDVTKEGLSEKKQIDEGLKSEHKRDGQNQVPGKPSKQKVKKGGQSFTIS